MWRDSQELDGQGALNGGWVDPHIGSRGICREGKPAWISADGMFWGSSFRSVDAPHVGRGASGAATVPVSES